MRLITLDDFKDTLLKGKQRGWDFILSKFTFQNNARTKSAFNSSAVISANWWEIPYVKKRWNKMMTNDEHQNYKQYLMETVLKDHSNLKLLSLGSGTCSHELELAQYKQFEAITCVDLSEYRISQAEKKAAQNNLQNISFVCSNIDNFSFKKEHYDVVLFNASLHHFRHVDTLLSEKIVPCLTSSGLLVINEYVGPNRLQFPKAQIQKINEGIQLLPKKFRRRYKSSLYKNSFSGSGLLRMIIADPSECVDSSSIMPSINKHFKVIIEKPYGGNILMNALKDISHHFIDLDDEKTKALDAIFEFEDEYLKHNPSDFVFGVYRKPEH
ncbi:class I SAM-dependent methyltransferase [uncultured Psychroserpens sp.]|uniref:class I SAM-dependent methyltransferase n=1 Tax=uncultured Psychroserpens sp. TaxID=255436 RepID=UPI00262F0C6B|nr:class I SAM-dependent methyltransferase [uncultured Psychroserpens sp.]